MGSNEQTAPDPFTLGAHLVAGLAVLNRLQQARPAGSRSAAAFTECALVLHCAAAIAASEDSAWTDQLTSYELEQLTASLELTRAQLTAQDQTHHLMAATAAARVVASLWDTDPLSLNSKQP